MRALKRDESQQRSEPAFVSVVEAARRLDIGKSLAYAMVRDGRLPSRKFGRCRRVPVAAVLEMVRQTVEPLEKSA